MGVAAYGVVANLSIVAFAIFNGLAQGAQPLISERLRKRPAHSGKKTSEMEPARMSCCRSTDPIDHLDFNRHANQHFQQRNNVQLLNYAHTDCVCISLDL